MPHNNNLLFWPVAIIVLTLYNLTPALNSFDTEFYILAGQIFLDGKIDCLRTPVYPLLCQAFIKMFDIEGLPTAMTVFQSLIYLLSLFSLQHIATYTIKNNAIRNITLFFYILCIAPGWCNELTTESLSISGCIILANWVVSLLLKPTLGKNILCHILLLLLVFLRPTFILFFAILPFLWIYQIIRTSNHLNYCLALGFTALCILCYAGYAKLYEKQYNYFGVSSTFVFNKIYDAHRGGYWEPSTVSSPSVRQWINRIDNQYDGTYTPTYQTIMQYPESLLLINQGCDEIIRAHKDEYKRYRLALFTNSFNTRLLAAVNTHTTLSSLLFATSLFLSFPVSLFYLFTLLATIATLVRFLQSKRIPLIFFFLNAIVLAQTIGIILTTSDAYERVLLPVYPIFLILLGIATERMFNIIKNN